MAKSDVAVKAKNEVVDPATMEAFAGFEGAGSEEVTARDRRIPRIAIIEPLSPQLKRNNEKYVEGAQVGDVVDTGVGEVVGNADKPLVFLPVKFVKEFLEWAPRDTGKGLQNRYKDAKILEQAKQNDKKAWILPNGNEVIETAEFFGLNLTSGGVWTFIPMSKGRYGAAKDFVERLARVKMPNGAIAPYFYQTWLLSPFLTNRNNNDYYTWNIKPGVKISEYGDNWLDIVAEAKNMLEALNAGTAKAEDESDVTDSGPADPETRF